MNQKLLLAVLVVAVIFAPSNSNGQVASMYGDGYRDPCGIYGWQEPDIMKVLEPGVKAYPVFVKMGDLQGADGVKKDLNDLLKCCAQSTASIMKSINKNTRPGGLSEDAAASSLERLKGREARCAKAKSMLQQIEGKGESSGQEGGAEGQSGATPKPGRGPISGYEIPKWALKNMRPDGFGVDIGVGRNPETGDMTKRMICTLPNSITKDCACPEGTHQVFGREVEGTWGNSVKRLFACK